MESTPMAIGFGSSVKSCSFNGVPFDCCQYFDQIYTELGSCFVTNSMHMPSYQRGERKLPMFSSNLTTGPGVMKFIVWAGATVHLKSHEETVFLPKENDDWNKGVYGSSRDMQTFFKTTEIINDPMLIEIPVEKRGCLYQSENPSEVFPIYGYSTCIIECHIKATIAECGCLPHIYPLLLPIQPKWNYTLCNMEGLYCISRKKAFIYQIKSMSLDEEGLTCDCLPSCDEIEFAVPFNHVNYQRDRARNGGDENTVTIAMDSLAKERFIRNIVRTQLDLVVSMGGAAGLFLGASLLSVVEIIYLCCIYRNRSPEEIWYESKENPKLLPKGKKSEKTRSSLTLRKPFRTAPPGYYPTEFPKLPQELKF